MTGFEIASALITALAVWLTARQTVWCWPVSLISVAMYTVVFWNARLYADTALQVVYGFFAVYGWWAWLHGGASGGALRVSRLQLWQLVASLGIGAMASVAMAGALGRWTDAAVPLADSTLTSFSLVAQWMMTRKKLENWVLWIIVDVGYVGLFINRALYPTAILYAGFIALAVSGLLQWRGSLVANEESLA